MNQAQSTHHRFSVENPFIQPPLAGLKCRCWGFGRERFLKMPSTSQYFRTQLLLLPSTWMYTHQQLQNMPAGKVLGSHPWCRETDGSRYVLHCHWFKKNKPLLPLPPTVSQLLHTFLWNEKRCLKCQTQPPSQSVWFQMRTRRRASITPRFKS